MNLCFRRFLFIPMWITLIYVIHVPGQPARSVSSPPDSLHPASQDSIRSLRPDTLIHPAIRPIHQTGSVSLTTSPENLFDSARINYTDYRSVADFFTLMPGVFTPELGSPGQYSDLTIGGLGLRNIAFATDNIRLNDPYTGTYNLAWYPTENIDRIEMIPGSRSYLYGINSTGGFLNALSISKKAIRPYSHLRYSEAAYGFAVIDGMISQDVARGLNVTAGGQHFTYGPRFTNTSYDSWSGRLKANYLFSSGLNFFASEIYTQTQLGLNGGIDIETTPDSLRFDRLQANVLNPDAYEKITRHDVKLGLAFRPGIDTSDVGVVTFFLSSSLRELRSGEHASIPPRPYLHQDQRTQWMGVKYSQALDIAGQKAEIGGEYQAERILLTPSTDETRAVSAAFFGTVRFEPARNIIISPGVRLDRYRSQNELAWGSEITFNPTNCTGLTVGYSLSHRYPTFQELWGAPPSVGTHLSDKSAEQHNLVESGFTWRYPSLLTVQLKGFHREIRDGIGIVPAVPGDTVVQYYFSRIGKQTLKGISVSASLQAGSFLIEGNFRQVWQSNDDDAGIYQPKMTGTGGLYYRDTLVHGRLGLKAGIRGSFFSSFTGRRFDQMSYLYLPDSRTVDIPSTGTIDLVIIAHIGDAYLHLVWDNLLDKTYFMTDYNPMTERQMRFGVSWSFED